jgi:hypothetical protein
MVRTASLLICANSIMENAVIMQTALLLDQVREPVNVRKGTEAVARIVSP